MNSTPETSEHHEGVITAYIASMNDEETLFLQECLEVFEAFVETSPIDAVKMLKFNEPLNGKKQTNWMGYYDWCLYETSSRRLFLRTSKKLEKSYRKGFEFKKELKPSESYQE
jgi:hypothetical protein